MLQLTDITLIGGSKLLLKNASSTFSSKQRIGIIGQNGSGKSTLFKAITQHIPLESGQISLPSDWKMGVLSQNLPECAGNVLSTACEGDTEWLQVNQTLLKAEEDNDAAGIAHGHERLAQIDGYTIEARASRICRGLGFSIEELSQPVSSFSGGWQMRVQLAKVLLSRADLLLLDEPTNHLDLESAIWLEAWLTQYKGCALIISHDRDFLDCVTTHSVHLSQMRLKVYVGGYTQFAKQRAEQLVLQSKSAKKADDKRAHLQSFVDRFRAKASKAKQAQSRLKALEKITFSADLEDESGFTFTFSETAEIPYPAITLTGALGYDASKPILSRVSFNIGTGERLGVIGSNGSGKTTFLKSLFGELPLLSGKCLIQPLVKVGYYSQQQLETLDMQASPFELLQRENKSLREGEIRSYLGGFNFQGDRVFEKITHFSGGEVARVALAVLVFRKPNILILDEPTNHLDIVMREALILALQNYTGALLVVSHDRHLLTSCVDNYVLVKDGSVGAFEGGFEEYRDLVLSEAGGDSKSGSRKKATVDVHQLKKKSQKVAREIGSIEKKLSALEVKLQDESLYIEPNNPVVIQAQEEKKKLNTKLDRKQDEWLTLEQKIDEQDGGS